MGRETGCESRWLPQFVRNPESSSAAPKSRFVVRQRGLDQGRVHWRQLFALRDAPHETLANLSINRPFTRLLGSTRVENLSRSCRAARWSREQFDSVAEASQFADHLARPHFLGLDADRWPAFFVAHALVQNLPDQPTQPVRDRPDGLGMAEAWDDAAIYDGEDRPLGLDGGIGGLIEDAAHLTIALGAAMAEVHAGTLLVAGTGAHPGGEM